MIFPEKKTYIKLKLKTGRKENKLGLIHRKYYKVKQIEISRIKLNHMKRK